MTTTTATAIEGLIENCRKAWGDALSRVAGTPCEVHASPDNALPQSMAAFGISDKGKHVMRLFMSHPPLEERIAALRNAQ